MKYELSFLPLEASEMRVETEEGKPKRIVGYAAVFNRKSEDLGGFVEIIRPGAFRKAIGDGADIRALFNHDPNYVIGRTTNGTLKLEENQTGLKYEVTPPDTQWARDLITSIERGDITGCSFSFRVAKDGEKWSSQGDLQLRELIDIEAVGDVGPVTYPAYPATSVSVRSKQEVFESYTAEEARARSEAAKIEARRALKLRKMRLELEKVK